MPGGDGTGPFGRGPGTGRGRGRGMSGGFSGKGGRPGAGPAGNCICPACGRVVPHQVMVPCASMECPQCGARMVRQ